MLRHLRTALHRRVRTIGRTTIAGHDWWIYSDGTALPVIAGGADADDPDADKDEPDDPDADEPDKDDPDADKDEPDDPDADEPDKGKKADELLGEKGKRALDKERAKSRREAIRRRAAEKRATDLDAELKKLKGDKDEPSADEIREQAREEAKAEALKDRVLDRIEARAGKKFEDPEDARLRLAKRADEFIDDGDIDNDAIDEALGELLDDKPHLAAKDGGGKKFKGGADGGARKTKDDKPKTLADAVSAKLEAAAKKP